MSDHVIVGAGAVGSATALLLAGRGEHVRLVTRQRQRTGAPRHRARRRGRDRRRAADRHHPGRRGALQLRQPAVPPVVLRLAAAGSGVPAAAERTGAVLVSRWQPVRLRPGGRPDHAEARRPPPPTPSCGCGPGCGTTSWPPCRPGGSAPPKSAPATTSRPTACWRTGSGGRCWPGSVPTRPRRWTCRTAGRRSPTGASAGCRRRRRARVRAGVAGPDEPGADSAAARG